MPNESTPSILTLDLDAQKLVFAASQLQAGNAAARQIAALYAQLVTGINGLQATTQYVQGVGPVQAQANPLTIRQRYAALGARAASGWTLLTTLRAMLVGADASLDASLPPVAPSGYTLTVNVDGTVVPVAIEAE